VHAASDLNGTAAVCAVEFYTHFQWDTTGNQTATAHVNTPVLPLYVPLAACR